MQRRLSIPQIPGEGEQHAPLNLQGDMLFEGSPPKRSQPLWRNPPALIKERMQHTPLSSITVGILGASTAYTELHINQLIETITQLWGKPGQLIFQQSGTAMMFIESWAEENKIPTIPVQPEWSKYGPKACFHVNNKIEKEATHIVIIRSPRAKSDKMLQKAEQLSSKRNKPCLVLMDVQPDGSAVIDSYEVPIKVAQKTKSNGIQDIRSMFMTIPSN